MTDERINIAIAEYRGYKRRGVMRSWYLPDGEGWCSYRDLPDCCNDLNAMHKAVMSLDRDSLDYSNYCSHLSQIVAVFNSSSKARPIQSCDATARQRAEAFLRTLNLWKD